MVTNKQIEEFNERQNKGEFHPYTCCGPSDILECERTAGKNDGVLIATKEGLVCPCGKYTQEFPI